MTEGFEGFNNNSGGPDGGAGNLNSDTTGQNPAWNEFLQVVPQEYHEQVTPLLQKWDQGVNQRFEKVHSDYAPWKNYIDQGITPDQVNMALNVLNTLQENPEYVWKSLGDYHKFGQEPVENQGGNGQGQGELENQGQLQDPRYDELSQNFGKLAEFVLQKQQADMEAQEDYALDQELASLRSKYGDFDEKYVMSQMLYGEMSGEQAVQEFQKMAQRLASQGPQPFSFLGGNSGGVPGTNPDVRKMSDSQARDAAVQMLQGFAAQKNQ
jgi:hypothetical protein